MLALVPNSALLDLNFSRPYLDFFVDLLKTQQFDESTINRGNGVRVLRHVPLLSIRLPLPCIPPKSLNRVPASAEVRAGM